MVASSGRVDMMCVFVFPQEMWLGLAHMCVRRQPSQDEWLSELLKSAQDARAAMRVRRFLFKRRKCMLKLGEQTSAGLEELNRYIEAGIQTIDV